MERYPCPLKPCVGSNAGDAMCCWEGALFNVLDGACSETDSDRLIAANTIRPCHTLRTMCLHVNINIDAVPVSFNALGAE